MRSARAEQDFKTDLSARNRIFSFVVLTSSFLFFTHAATIPSLRGARSFASRLYSYNTTLALPRVLSSFPPGVEPATLRLPADALTARPGPAPHRPPLLFTRARAHPCAPRTRARRAGAPRRGAPPPSSASSGSARRPRSTPASRVRARPARTRSTRTATGVVRRAFLPPPPPPRRRASAWRRARPAGRRRRRGRIER